MPNRNILSIALHFYKFHGVRQNIYWIPIIINGTTERVENFYSPFWNIRWDKLL